MHPRFPEVPVLVRTSRSGDEAAAVIRHVINAIDPGIAVRPATTGEAYLRDSLAPARFAVALLAAFAAIAIVLSAVGLYGVIAYTVTQRTRELGIRIALGAEPAGIATLVVGTGLRHALVGTSMGAVIAVASSRLISSMLYAVSPADPLTIVAAIVLIASVSVLASYMPARRAARIDPITALRVE